MATPRAEQPQPDPLDAWKVKRKRRGAERPRKPRSTQSAHPPPPAGRKKWRDYEPPDAPPRKCLLTREQLLEHLAWWWGLEPPVKESNLRFWEYHGILPAAVRQSHHGATRAVYPLWMSTLVATLRLYQSGGRRLDELAPLLAAEAQKLAREDDPPDLEVRPDEPFVPQHFRPPFLSSRLPGSPLPLSLWRDYTLRTALLHLAERHREEGVVINQAAWFIWGGKSGDSLGRAA